MVKKYRIGTPVNTEAVTESFEKGWLNARVAVVSGVTSTARAVMKVEW